MVNTLGTALAVPLFLASILLTPGLIQAQNLADHDAKEIADYMLTEPALAKYTKAVHTLQPLMGQLAQDCDREEGSTSLNDMATRMDGVSGVKPALKAAGITSREYLVFSWSVFQSGMAVFGSAADGRQVAARCENGKRQLRSHA